MSINLTEAQLLALGCKLILTTPRGLFPLYVRLNRSLMIPGTYRNSGFTPRPD